MTKRTPTGDAGNTGRGKERLVDPEDSGHFDPAIADPPDEFGMVEDGHYVPVRDGDTLVTGNRDVQPHPVNAAAINTEVLPAVPPDGVQAADPPATPGNSGETPEPSPQVPHGLPAGSGGGWGRPKAHTPDPGHEPPGAAGELAGSLLRAGEATGLEASPPRPLERPGQVAAAFGTSSGDIPFQAALMKVLVPAERDDDANILGDEMAQLGGLLATAGRIASEYHRHGRLAEPGLLVALRFQANALCVGRGLAP